MVFLRLRHWRVEGQRCHLSSEPVEHGRGSHRGFWERSKGGRLVFRQFHTRPTVNRVLGSRQRDYADVFLLSSKQQTRYFDHPFIGRHQGGAAELSLTCWLSAARARFARSSLIPVKASRQYQSPSSTSRTSWFTKLNIFTLPRIWTFVARNLAKVNLARELHLGAARQC